MHGAKELSKILVAVDGSEVSIRAAVYAFEIAMRSNSRCTLYIMHVIPPHTLLAHSSGFFEAVPTDYRKESKKRQRNDLTE